MTTSEAFSNIAYDLGDSEYKANPRALYTASNPTNTFSKIKDDLEDGEIKDELEDGEIKDELEDGEIIYI